MHSATPPQSAIYRTAERAVGGDLPAFLADHRKNGTSYNRIASLLQDRGVMVTYQTVANWVKRLRIDEAA